jgi:hypothetical protein
MLMNAWEWLCSWFANANACLTPGCYRPWVWVWLGRGRAELSWSVVTRVMLVSLTKCSMKWMMGTWFHGTLWSVCTCMGRGLNLAVVWRSPGLDPRQLSSLESFHLHVALELSIVIFVLFVQCRTRPKWVGDARRHSLWTCYLFLKG